MTARSERRTVLNGMTISRVARVAKRHGIESAGRCFDELVNAILDIEHPTGRYQEAKDFDLAALLWGDAA